MVDMINEEHKIYFAGMEKECILTSNFLHLNQNLYLYQNVKITHKFH